MSVQILTFPNDQTPVDLLLFLAFKREVPGLVETVLADNPGLAAMGPYPPRGTKISVTAPAPEAVGVNAPLLTLYA